MRDAHCRVAVLISGSGSNLQALLDTFAAPDAPAQIVGVVSNRPGAGGLERAATAGVATAVVDHRQFADRQAFERALLERVVAFKPDLVVLAGFMRILGADFVRHFAGRLFNIHPSLLPLYPGLDTHQRALDAGDSHAGATVHFVTEELDGGPAIIQATVPVVAGDDHTALAQRVLTVEHRIYPQAVEWFATGRLRLAGEHAELDGTALPRSGYRFEELASRSCQE